MAHPFPSSAASTRQPLRVELFYLAHSDAGEPLANRTAVSLALAGATLIGLVQPVERIRLIGGNLVVPSVDLTGDPVADWAARALYALRGAPVGGVERPSLSLREALRQLAAETYLRTVAGMIAGDLIRETTKRRGIGMKRTAYPPTDPAVIPRVRGRVRGVIQGLDQPDPQTDALAGLIRALNLEPELYLDGLGADVRTVMRDMVNRAGASCPPVKEIIQAVELLIGDAAISVYG